MSLIGLYTLTRKEIQRFMRIWSQTLLPPAITMSLYFLIFGTFIGSQIDDLHGVSYIAFIVPGLVMMSIITNSYSNVSSSFFGSKFQKNIEELLVSPMSNWQVLLGFVAGGVSRGLLVGVIVTLVSLFFTKLVLSNILIVFAFAILTAITFSLGGFTNGMFAKRFDDVTIVPTFILTPLTYLGGVFYSIDVLPALWQKVSLLNPIVYMVAGFRHGFLGFSEIPVWIGLLVLSGFTVGFFFVNMYLLRTGKGLKE